jgi:hypothetical protein
MRTIVGERLRPVYVLLEGDDAFADEGEGGLSEDEVLEMVRREFDAEEFVDEPEANEGEAKEA